MDVCTSHNILEELKTRGQKNKRIKNLKLANKTEEQEKQYSIIAFVLSTENPLLFDFVNFILIYEFFSLLFRIFNFN